MDLNEDCKLFHIDWFTLGLQRAYHILTSFLKIWSLLMSVSPVYA